MTNEIIGYVSDALNVLAFAGVLAVGVFVKVVAERISTRVDWLASVMIDGVPQGNDAPYLMYRSKEHIRARKRLDGSYQLQDGTTGVPAKDFERDWELQSDE